MSVLEGRLTRLRPAGREDVADLARIRATPEIRARWRGGDDLVAAVEEDLADPDTTGYVVELSGRAAGWIQWASEEEPDYRHASIDIYIDPAVHGRGIGTDAARITRHLLASTSGTRTAPGTTAC